jgi:hypothetical protein
VHLAGAVRDVDADRALDAVLVPLDDVAGGIARPDETVVIAPVPRILASAEAGDVAQDLGVLGGELVRGGDDLFRPRRLVALERNRRKARLIAWPELGLRLRLGDRDRRGLSRGRRRRG